MLGAGTLAKYDLQAKSHECRSKNHECYIVDVRRARKGCVREVQNSHVTTVLDVRRARSDERVVSRLGQPNPPCVKKERNFLRSLDPQPFSADLLSTAILSRSSRHSHSQQIFSAQPFSADLLSYHVAAVRGWWSAIVLSCWWSILSTTILSRSSQHSHSQQIFSQQQGRLSTLSRSHHFSALLWLWRSSRMVGKAASRSLAVGRCSGIATSLYRSMWSRNQREVFWLKEKCARNGIPKGEFMGGLVKLRNLNACFILRRAWDLNGSSRCAANL